MTTEIHVVRDVALKGFGLYCIAYTVSTVLSQLFFFLPDVDIPIIALASGIALLIGYAVLGYLCVFRTRTIVRAIWREDESAAANSPLPALTPLIILISLYFAIQAAGLVVFFAWEARLPDAFTITHLTGAAVTLALAVWAMRRAKPIARFIQKRG